MTGFYRTGYCAVGPDDVGVRTTEELFLQRQASVPLWPPLTLGAPGEVALPSTAWQPRFPPNMTAS